MDLDHREFRKIAFIKPMPKKSAKGKAKGNRIGTNTNAIVRAIQRELKDKQ